MSQIRGTLIREGKAKILYETAPPSDNVIQFFKDDATAFNAEKRGQIVGKGAINAAISTWVFEHLESKGIPTHFVEHLSERELLTRKLEMIPVEIVVRNRAAGSLVRRLGISKGSELAPPLVEYFYKSDALGDPLIGETHILQFGWASAAELHQMRERALAVNAALVPWFESIGLDLIDFKLEFGRTREHTLVLADEFSPDGCRLWDRTTSEPMDKDRFRHDLGGVQEAYAEVYQRLLNRRGGKR